MAISVENRQIFHPHVFIAPLNGFPLDLVSAQGSEDTRMMELPDGRKSFKIGLAVLIQYQRVTDSQPPSQPRCRSKYRAYYVARVTRSSADADNGLDAFVGQSRSTNILGPFQVK